jgi:hypothetical protein
MPENRTTDANAALKGGDFGSSENYFSYSNAQAVGGGNFSGISLAIWKPVGGGNFNGIALAIWKPVGGGNFSGIALAI